MEMAPACEHLDPKFLYYCDNFFDNTHGVDVLVNRDVRAGTFCDDHCF